PIALEGMDEVLIAGMKKKGGAFRDHLSMLPDGKGWLMAEFGEETKDQAIERANEFMERLRSHAHPPTMKLFTSDEDQENMWQVRESGLGATAFVPGDPRHMGRLGRFCCPAGESWRVSACVVQALREIRLSLGNVRPFWPRLYPLPNQLRLANSSRYPEMACIYGRSHRSGSRL